jgi:GT2 family glycosyltransferase
MCIRPTIYVVLVNWNGRDVTLDCLASLHAVTYRQMKILVVDNASTDGSAQAFAEGYPDVEVLLQKENLRFAGGNNVGIRHALKQGADAIMLLNNDTLVDPGFIEPMVDRLLSDPSCGIVAPKILYADAPQSIWFAGGEISMWTGTMRHTGIRERDHGQFDMARTIDYASGCCLLTSRTVIEKAGMLDELYFMYSEDADWSMRVRNAGYRIVFEPQAKVWHRLSVSAGGHLSSFKLRNKAVSNFRFFARYATWYHWLTFPWMSIVVNLHAAVRYVSSLRPRQ